jgi:hypothetical protein
MKTLFAFIYLAILAHSSAFEVFEVKSLGKGDESLSFDTKGVCYMDFSGKDWNLLKLKAAGKSITLWRCVRSVGVSWSPNSKYLAVEDYLDRISRVVLVFRVDLGEGRADLIYQTPYSNSVFDKYYITGWSEDGCSILIQKKSHTIDAPQEVVGPQEVIGLRKLKTISQSVYPP